MIDLLTYISLEWVLIETYDVDGYVTKREYYDGIVKQKEIEYALEKTGSVVDKITPTYKLYQNGIESLSTQRKAIIPANLGEVVISKETKGATKGIKI